MQNNTFFNGGDGKGEKHNAFGGTGGGNGHGDIPANCICCKYLT